MADEKNNPDAEDFEWVEIQFQKSMIFFGGGGLSMIYNIAVPYNISSRKHWILFRKIDFFYLKLIFIKIYYIYRYTCVCLGFTSHSKISHSYGDVTITSEELQIFTCTRHSWLLSSEGSLACHTYCDTGYLLILVISEDPWHSPLAERLTVELSLPVFMT